MKNYQTKNQDREANLGLEDNHLLIVHIINRTMHQIMKEKMSTRP